ncbi:MAG: PAS domain S-box protein [Caldilineaceae bacterium]
MMVQAHSHSAEAYQILILDDTVTLAGHLYPDGSDGFACQTAATFAQFETLFQQQAWDLVLCHHGHSPCETTVLLQLATRLYPHTPVLVTGEQLTSHQACEFERLGAYASVILADKAHLLDCVRQATSARKAAKQAGATKQAVVHTGSPTADHIPQAVGAVPNEPKQGEDELRRSEAYLRSLVNSQTAFNLRVDMQGKITYCNERYRRQFAWAAPSIVGMTPLEVVHPEDQHKVYAAVADCFADANKIARFEIRKRTESGDYMWTLWEFSAVLDSAGSIQEIHCVGFDITQQKEAEAALHEAKRLLEQRIQERTAELEEERNLLRTVIDAIPDFIYVKDRQHRMLLNNRAHIQSIGRASGAELLGKTDLDLYPQTPAAQFHADEERMFESEQPIVNLEEHSTRPDGSDAWMLTTKVPLRNLQGEVTGLVGITRDITALKEAEAAIRAALAHEKELGELKSRLVSMASHEFRNPLAGILTTTEALVLLWDSMDKTKIDDRLNRIRDQVLRLSGITDDVLQLTRLQTGRSTFAPAPGDLDELCGHVVRDLAELPEYHDRIHYECTQRPLLAVFDARLLQQAISNLLHNALKYSPPEKGVCVAMARAPGQGPGHITVRIADEGIGIPEGDLQRLFEPFRRATNVGAIQGTGLGLAIAKEAVELHGGTIVVESQVGVGTTFIVTLPDGKQPTGPLT